MSGAVMTLQRQVLERLQDEAALMALVTGIFDGPPPRQAFPYIALDSGLAADWSHKTARGRELMMVITVHDDGRSAARLHRIMALIEEALETEFSDPPDWQIVNFRFRRSRIVRRAAAPWRGIIEIRARMLEQ